MRLARCCYSTHRNKNSVIDEWNKRIKTGQIRNDPNQYKAVLLLDDLLNKLETYKPPHDSQPYMGFWSQKTSMDVPKGIYLWGGVGSGKTMLMDLFVDVFYHKKARRNRVHFNSFMIDFHSKVHKWRQDPTAKKLGQDHAVDALVGDIIAESPVLCFDEFQVTNIADAMMLGRLFNSLWSRGAVLISTSNRPPDDLYKGGLQRELFLPFISNLKEHCVVHCLDSKIDYRLSNIKMSHVYHVGKNKKQELDKLWNQLTENRVGSPLTLEVQGRHLHVPMHFKGVARFSFSDLCEKPLGPGDYHKIATGLHTILVDDIPCMDLSKANEARRFITFIDELYQQKAKLICSAEVEPGKLFPLKMESQGGSNVAAGEEEVFAFSRVVSRLNEMQTKEYLESKHFED